MTQRESPGTFLLGVGAQKAGTAWLHRYLESSPQCDPGFRKEYHVWDGLYLPQGESVRARVAQNAIRAGRALESGDHQWLGDPTDANALRRALFYTEPESYFDYFEALLRRDERIRLTADITPAYAELPTARLAAIRDGFVRRGVRPVAVYLMRDPVERIWSAVRMDSRRGSDAVPGDPDAYVAHAATRPMYADRTRYDLTMDKLGPAFDDDVLYVLYEQLFDRTTLDRVCAFLGIDAHEPDLERQVNVSPKSQESLPDDVVRSVARTFPEVYSAVARRFPDLDLQTVWPSARFL